MKAFLFIFCFTILASCTCCTKEGSKKSAYIDCTFQVGEQENVESYVLETSGDGANFKTSGIILASDKLEDNYHIKVRVSEYASKMIYARIKSVDRDGKSSYSATTTFLNY